jgi:hypothetical protein
MHPTPKRSQYITSTRAPARSSVNAPAWPFHRTPRNLVPRRGSSSPLRPARYSPPVLPIIAHPYVAGRIEDDIYLKLKPTTDITAGRRDLVAHLHTGRAGLGPVPAQLDNTGGQVGEVGNPDVIVTVHIDAPWHDEATPEHRRPGRFAAVRPQYRDTAPIWAGMYFGHRADQEGIPVPPGLCDLQHVFEGWLEPYPSCQGGW